MPKRQQRTATWSRFANVDQEAEPAAFVRHMNTLAGLDLVKAYKQETFGLLEAKAGAKLLDVGCGPGTDARELAALVGPDGRVVGVDKSETMIAEARQLIQNQNLPLQYQIGDAYGLEFADNAFDGCRADRVLHHLDRPQTALAEIIRVVRPGGWIVLVDPDFDGFLIDSPDKAATRKVMQKRSDLYPNGRCGRQLFGLLKKAGLTDVTVAPTPIVFEDFDFVDQHVLGLRDAAEALRHSGELSSQQVEDWLGQLAQASREGLFFCMTLLFIARGRKPIKAE